MWNFTQKLHNARNNLFKELKFQVDHENSPDNLLNKRSNSSKGKRSFSNRSKQLTRQIILKKI
ncbi:hypothetical protein WN944_006862 [Citrus x changshan-huyou]|uniref:Uncharacterized protein n=1 Tax=Citrus x changshan-huyou TaxID=2935761 RepID=A0AAP0QXJ3_9ROSI